MNSKEEERRARLLKSRAERLPDIKRQFEEAQNRNFNSNFKPGGKDAELVASDSSSAKTVAKKPKTASEGKKTAKKTTKKTKGENPAK